MITRLRTGSAEERAQLFNTVEQLLTDGDTLIDDAVDNEIIDELVYLGYSLKDDPVDLSGAGPRTTERITGPATGDPASRRRTRRLEAVDMKNAGSCAHWQTPT